MILVTGATGHIGNVLVRKLVERGEKIRALILPGEDTSSLKDLAIEKLEGNVLEPDSLKKPFEDVGSVYHLAGVISIMPGQQPWVWRVNVEGTQNILQAATTAGVSRLVYTSSIHAIQRLDTGVIDESLPYDPDNPYGTYDRSKAAATLEVKKAAQTGLNAVIACPTGVIGPYDYRGSMMGSLIRSAASQRTTAYVEGAYDFVDVRDVADGLIALAERGRTGESYILSGQRMSLRYLIETIHEITGRGFTRFRIPTFLARFATLFTPFFYRLFKATPRFTPYSLEVLFSNSHISHAKATRELGYAPRMLYESLADTVRWYFDNRRLVRGAIIT